MIIGVITCWYKNLAMANYSRNLTSHLRSYPFVDVIVISSPCSCARIRFTGLKDILEIDSCQFVNFPPCIDMYPERKTGWIAYSIIQYFSHLVRGMIYLLKCKGCDIIHYQKSSSSFGILPLIPIMLIPTSNRKVITVHTVSKGDEKLSRYLYNRADKIIVHSRDITEILISLGVNPSKIVVIPHGVRIPPLFPKERTKIIFFGAPIKDKGAFVLLETLRILKERGEKITVSFYGIYSFSEKESFCSRARELGVDDCIVFGGRLSERQFDKKMQESIFTFAIYTSPVSGSSIATRAMANATPVIGTNVGGLPEYLQDFGVLIPPNDPRALADAIVKLMRDPSLRKNLGEAAREHSLRISWKVIAEKHLRVYRDITTK